MSYIFLLYVQVCSLSFHAQCMLLLLAMGNLPYGELTRTLTLAHAHVFSRAECLKIS